MAKLSKKEAETVIAFLNRTPLKGVQEAEVLLHLVFKLREEDSEDAIIDESEPE